MKSHRQSTLVGSQLGVYRPWGRVTATPPDLAKINGSFSIRIAIYRPGVDAAARRRLHALSFMLNLPGVLALLAACVMTAVLTGSVWWMLAPAILYAWVLVMLALATRADRRDVRHVVAHIWKRGSVGIERLIETSNALQRLDRSDFDPVLYDMAWANIYDDAGTCRDDEPRP